MDPGLLFFTFLSLALIFGHGAIARWNMTVNPFLKRHPEKEISHKVRLLIFGALFFLISFFMNSWARPIKRYDGILFYIFFITSGLLSFWILFNLKSISNRCAESNFKFMRFNETIYRIIFLLISSGLLFVCASLLYQALAILNRD